VKITGEDIDKILKESKVDDIFPEVTAENDPWNSCGAVLAGGESAWNDSTGWNEESPDLALV
jgi:hypothetical protein